MRALRSDYRLVTTMIYDMINVRNRIGRHLDGVDKLVYSMTKSSTDPCYKTLYVPITIDNQDVVELSERDLDCLHEHEDVEVAPTQPSGHPSKQSSADPSAGIVTNPEDITEYRKEKPPPRPSNPKGRFKCTRCNVRRATKAAIRSHLLEHRGQSLQCSVCFKKYTNQTSLRVHSFTHVHGYKYCNICFKSFSTNTQVKNHMDSHARKGLGQCPIPNCPNPTITNASNFSRHRRTHHKDIPSSVKFKRPQTVRYESTAEWKASTGYNEVYEPPEDAPDDDVMIYLDFIRTIGEEPPDWATEIRNRVNEGNDGRADDGAAGGRQPPSSTVSRAPPDEEHGEDQPTKPDEPPAKRPREDAGE